MLPDPTQQRGITVLERGWLSCNNVLLHGDGTGAVLVDSSHSLHAAQTVALVQHALVGEVLLRLVNTHLHSDHCGGNAAVQQAFGCAISIPPGDFDAAVVWDASALSYQATGQRCDRFAPDARIAPGDVLAVGTRRWNALAAPGHDPHSIVLFDDQNGVLISADALWENGFGVVFPELDGVAAFDDVARALDLIASLDARWVIPGHGAPFGDVAGALSRARHRLAGFLSQPERHARHAARVLLKYHLLEVQNQPRAEVLHWFESTPLCLAIWQRLDKPEGSPRSYGEAVLGELLGSGALRLAGDLVSNA